MKKLKKILWITDPWETLDHPRDTSLRLVEAGMEMNFQQYWCNVKSIRLENQKVLLNAKLFQSIEFGRKSDSFSFGKDQVLRPHEFSLIHYRTDPPIDHAYLHPLQLLSLGLEGHRSSEMVNPFEVLFQCNEKIEGVQIQNLMPPSIISSELHRLQSFGKAQGSTVLKPLHEAQSHGIELLHWKNSNQKKKNLKLLSRATQQFQNPILLQKYLPGIQEGETRLWFIDGKLLAYVKKLPLAGDFKVNLDLGSQLALTELSQPEKKRIPQISKHLKNRKIRLAAVDLIEGYVTDFNFTSPGLIPLMEKILGVNLAKPIIKALNPVAG